MTESAAVNADRAGEHRLCSLDFEELWNSTEDNSRGRAEHRPGSARSRASSVDEFETWWLARTLSLKQLHSDTAVDDQMSSSGSENGDTSKATRAAADGIGEPLETTSRPTADVPDEHLRKLSAWPDVAADSPTWAAASSWKLTPPSLEHIIPRLTMYGWFLSGAGQWAKDLPTAELPILELSVDQHVKRSKHQWYITQCRLDLPSALHGLSLQWAAPRRVCHFRQSLYDQVRGRLDPSYASLIDAAPFARFQGPRRTVEKLDAWLRALSGLVNFGRAPPFVIAVILDFLAAPTPDYIHHTSAFRLH